MARPEEARRPADEHHAVDVAHLALAEREHADREHDQHELRRPTRATPASCRSRRPSGPGRSGRCCRSSARAAPRRPVATAARCRRCAISSGQNSAPCAEQALRAAAPRRSPARPARSPGRRRRRRRTRPRARARDGSRSPGRARRSAKLLVGGQHHPQAGVQRHARAPPRAAVTHERRAHPQHGHAEVGGQAGGDAADHAILRVAGRAPVVNARHPAGRGPPVASRVGVLLIVRPSSQTAAAPDHEDDPDATLTAPARAGTRTRGGIRGVPDGARRRGGAGLEP